MNDFQEILEIKVVDLETRNRWLDVLGDWDPEARNLLK